MSPAPFSTVRRSVLELHASRPLAVAMPHIVYGTWFWTVPRQQAAVLLFANVLAPAMNLPLFAEVVAAVEAG
jgi:hypothetical protein